MTRNEVSLFILYAIRCVGCYVLRTTKDLDSAGQLLRCDNFLSLSNIGLRLEQLVCKWNARVVWGVSLSVAYFGRRAL